MSWWPDLPLGVEDGADLDGQVLLLVLAVDVVDLVDPDVGVRHPEAHCLSPELGVAVEGHKLAGDVRVNYLKR